MAKFRRVGRGGEWRSGKEFCGAETSGVGEAGRGEEMWRGEE
jgi:hypothetical protein